MYSALRADHTDAMPIAVLADVYGNPLALNAVVAGLSRQRPNTQLMKL